MDLEWGVGDVDGNGFGVAVGLDRELRGLDAVRLHIAFIGMAVAASCGYIEWIYSGARVARGTDFMNAVAVSANRNLSVARQ